MTTFIEPLPGLLDDPLLHLPDLPPRTDVRIPPLRDPFPSRAFSVPSPLEPNAPDDGQLQGGVKLGSRKDASDQHPGTPKITPADAIFVRDTRNSNLAISALVDSSSAAHPVRALPPSFVNLAAVENKPSQPWLPDYPPSKRWKSDQEYQIDYLQLPKPQQKEVSQRVPLLPTIVNGIHEPPPSAALLPPMELEEVDAMLASISEPETLPLPPEKMLNPAEPDQLDVINQDPFKPSSSAGALGFAMDHSITSTNKPARTWKKWSDEESQQLLTGVVQHGPGRWKQICADPDLKFRDRKPMDLKDRFRVICTTVNKEKDDGLVHLESDSSLTSSSGQPQSNTTVAEDPSSSTNANPSSSSDPPTDNRNSTNVYKRIGLSNILRSDPLTDLALSKSRVNQRVRKHWTEAEHHSLMRGFAKHGYQWTTIRNDIELNLSHRKATDLRDKFRSLFPQQYMDAESAPPRRQSVGTGRPVGAPRKYPDVSLPKKSSSESSASGISYGRGRFTIAGGSKRNSTTAAAPFSASRRSTKPSTSLAPPTCTAGGGATAAGAGGATAAALAAGAGGGAAATSRPDEGSRDNFDNLSEAVMPQQYHHHNAESSYSAAGAVGVGSNVTTLPPLALGDINDWDWDDNKLAPLLDWEEFDL